MKTILNESISKNPIRVPDAADLQQMGAIREKIAREVEAQEALDKAKETDPSYKKVLLDSYSSLQVIERTAIMLDPKKPDFIVTFSGLQGRWRERMALTEELTCGRTSCSKKRNLLKRVSEKIEALKLSLRRLK